MTTPVPISDSGAGSEAPKVSVTLTVFDTVSLVPRGLPVALPATLPLCTYISAPDVRLLAAPLFPIAGPGPASGAGGFQPPRDRRVTVYGP